MKIFTHPDIIYMNDGILRTCFSCGYSFSEIYAVDTGAKLCADCLQKAAEKYNQKLGTMEYTKHV
jgi:hypothetical protein